MNFSPEQEAKVLAEYARIMAKEAMEAAGGAKRLVVLPMPTACQMTGLSRHTLPKLLPVTETSPGKFGVTIENLEAYLDGKTVWPGQDRQKAKATAATVAPAK